MRRHTSIIAGLAAVVLMVALTGCAELSGALGTLADMGIVDSDVAEAAAVGESAAGVISAINETFTPEQQYYVGRSVAAVILDTYDPLENPTAAEYLNKLGQALALASPQPQLFVGYRFMILDSDEINAFATPGGHIFVSRGMIRLAETEDDLAAVLAHEITHVVLQHGMKTIKSARISSSAVGLLKTSADALTDGQIAELTTAFSGSIDDMTQTLVTSGYSRATEREADAGAVELLATVGYDPEGLVRVLQRMKDALDPDGHDFAKTHPDPEVRIAWVQEMIDEKALVGRSDTRITQRRFDTAVGGL